jgi:hypothetical protein
MIQYRQDGAHDHVHLGHDRIHLELGLVFASVSDLSGVVPQSASVAGDGDSPDGEDDHDHPRLPPGLHVAKASDAD